MTSERGFARDERGRMLFTAPWGRTYVVSDAQSDAALRRIVKRSPVLLSLATSAVVAPLVIHRRPWYWVLVATPFLAALALIPIYRATRGLERVRFGRPTLEIRGELARSISSASLWLYEALMLAAVFLAAPSLARHGQTGLAWATGALSAAAAIAFARLLWLRRRR